MAKKRYTKAEKAEFVKKQRQQQIDRLEAAAKQLMTSEGWMKWLQARSKFRKYSLNNQWLIAMQCPHATYVAGYRKWQELNRQVRKGEKAITILGPAVKRYTETDAETGEDVERKRLYFIGLSVFDISQTDGDPLPKLPAEPIEGDSHRDYIAKLVAYANSIGSKVEFCDLSQRPEGGWFNPHSKEIVIDSSKSINGQVRTLIHEIAHAHGVDYSSYTREQSECIVESVSFVVAGSVGLDTSGESVSYVTGWGSSTDLKALREFAEIIHDVATKIEKGVGLNGDAPANKVDEVAA